jgi:hypothetical protein
VAGYGDFIKAVKDGLLVLGKDEVGTYASELVKDGEKFIEENKADLLKWGEQLASGKMTAAEFEFAVRGRQRLLHMEALTQAGLAAIRVDELKHKVVETIVGAANKTFVA